jgi:kynureninase
MPTAARDGVARELERWSRQGVAGHFEPDGWFDFHRRFAEPLAGLLGAEASEVVAMNALTVNLHLMLVSFFTPDGDRNRILIERGAFPSDRFAVQSQLAHHGLDPQRDLVELAPDSAGRLSADALDAALMAEAGRVALVLLPGVQYLTGEAIDLAACAAVARRHGARLGLDLAHAIGNLALDLRASEPDFAVWCSYKYLNGGPGAIGGCFVNRRWTGQAGLTRLAGWWGHDATSRFTSAPAFSPVATAEGWQLSNPPILAMIPLEASLELFAAAGIQRLRAKSMALTAYLESLLTDGCGARIELLSPREPDARGAQLSFRLRRDAVQSKALVATLQADGIIVDWRAPDVLRVAPVPLYNSFADVHACVARLSTALGD